MVPCSDSSFCCEEVSLVHMDSSGLSPQPSSSISYMNGLDWSGVESTSEFYHQKILLEVDWTPVVTMAVTVLLYLSVFEAII